MFITTLPTSNPEIMLIEPNVARHAPLSVAWLAGPHGRDTLRLMGVEPRDNKASTLEQEEARIRSFLENDDQLNWMISVNNEVAGAVWVDLRSHNELPGPSVHIMIGDPAQRGKGAGRAAVQAVVDFLRSESTQEIYSRHLTANKGAAALLASCGFQPYGRDYRDKDGLGWQNAILT